MIKRRTDEPEVKEGKTDLGKFKPSPETIEGLKVILRNIPDMVSLMDRDGRFLFVNKTVPGLTVEDVVGRTVYDFMPPEDRETTRSALSKAFETAEQVEYESRGIGPDDTVAWYSTTFSPMMASEGVEAVVAITTDITAMKIAREQLRNTQRELEQSKMMGELGTMAGGIAHDFNNILAAIMGNAGWLVSLDVNSLSPEDKREHSEVVSDILQATKRGSDMVKKILLFANPQIGELENINVNEIIEETIGLVRKTALNKQIRYDLELEPHPLSIKGDRTQIHRAIFNIVFNAADAIPEQGQIKVATKNTIMDGKEAVCITISDNGSGMPAEVVDQIFKPFFTTKGKAKGTGLGLSVTWSIVQSHRGKIEVDSEPGVGTSFELIFPAKEESVPPKVSSRTTGPIKLPGKVLIIDDEEPLRRVGKRIIGRNGTETLLAKNGAEGIQMYADNQESVSLVILDMIMPDMNGDKVLSAIREMSKDVKVIICSGYSDDLTRQALLSLGADVVLNKPYDVLTLQETINTVFREK